VAPTSAGLLAFRRSADGAVEVLLAHPGGPFFAKKDAGAWTIPKGAPEAGESLEDAARREFREEIGTAIDDDAPLLALGSVRQAGGKTVHAFAAEVFGWADPVEVRSNTFELEWPPRSGRTHAFPEVDRAAFFTLDAAASMLLAAQRPFLDRLRELLAR